MYITNLNYLEDKSSYFMELPNGGTEKSNKILVGLDIIAVISNTNK